MSDPLAFGIDLASVRARLEGLGYFMNVLDVRAATEAVQGEVPCVPPAAFVSVASETANEDRFIRGSGGHAQLVDVTISTLFCESIARAQGHVSDQVEQTRKAVIRQLVAWQPEGAQRSFQYSRYLLRGMSDGLVWCEVLMRTCYRL